MPPQTLLRVLDRWVFLLQKLRFPPFQLCYEFSKIYPMFLLYYHLYTIKLRYSLSVLFWIIPVLHSPVNPFVNSFINFQYFYDNLLYHTKCSSTVHQPFINSYSHKILLKSFYEIFPNNKTPYLFYSALKSPSSFVHQSVSVK